jgi:hypothetical protein
MFPAQADTIESPMPVKAQNARTRGLTIGPKFGGFILPLHALIV